MRIQYVDAAMPSDIFVSYARESAEVVERFLAALSADSGDDARHIAVFRDVQSIRAAELWDEALVQAILRTRVLLAFVSSAYTASHMCMFELILFMSRELIQRTILNTSSGEVLFVSRVIPFRTENCEMPLHLARLNAPMITLASVGDPQLLAAISKQIVMEVERAARPPSGLNVLRPSEVYDDWGRDVWLTKSQDRTKFLVKDAIKRSKNFLRDSRNSEEKAALLNILEKTQNYYWRLTSRQQLEALGYSFVESDLPPIVRDWCVGEEVLCLIEGEFEEDLNIPKHLKPFPRDKVLEGYSIFEGMVVLPRTLQGNPEVSGF